MNKGVFDPIPRSTVWPAGGPDQSDDDLELLLPNSTWQSAAADPETTARRAQAEIAEALVQIPDGDLDASRAHVPRGIAVGKLGVQDALGRNPRVT